MIGPYWYEYYFGACEGSVVCSECDEEVWQDDSYEREDGEIVCKECNEYKGDIT